MFASNYRYKICEFIHRQNQDWTALFFIYTQDPSKEVSLLYWFLSQCLVMTNRLVSLFRANCLITFIRCYHRMKCLNRQTRKCAF